MDVQQYRDITDNEWWLMYMDNVINNINGVKKLLRNKWRKQK